MQTQSFQHDLFCELHSLTLHLEKETKGNTEVTILIAQKNNTKFMILLLRQTTPEDALNMYCSKTLSLLCIFFIQLMTTKGTTLKYQSFCLNFLNELFL